MRLFFSLFLSILSIQFVCTFPAQAKSRSQSSTSSPFPWFEDQFEESHDHDDLVDSFDD